MRQETIRAWRVGAKLSMPPVGVDGSLACEEAKVPSKGRQGLRLHATRRPGPRVRAPALRFLGPTLVKAVVKEALITGVFPSHITAIL
jgi:hypothetical protein